MNFVIRVTYQTGDSFKTYTDTEVLDYGWDEETAKLNAEFIIEHYKAYEGLNNTCYHDKPNMEEIMQKPWYNKPQWSSIPEVDFTLKLLPGKKGGDPIMYCCPWCGYFESVESVEVVSQKFVLYPN